MTPFDAHVIAAGADPNRAACHGAHPDLFFPADLAGANRAKRICRTCPIKAECLDYALVHGERHGVWGETSEAERRKLRRKMRLGLKAVA